MPGTIPESTDSMVKKQKTKNPKTPQNNEKQKRTQEFTVRPWTRTWGS